MDHPAVHFVTILTAFFAIMNPIANAPIFLGLTDGLDAPTRRGIALRAVVAAFALVAGFSLFGRVLFAVFGITLPAFRIAGGALVALVGYHLLQGQPSPVHAPSDGDGVERRDAAIGVAITPLAIPLLAGPGTIATAMSFAAGADAAELFRILAAFALVCVATWLAFAGGEAMVRVLGRNAIQVAGRLMGLLLAVIGVQMLIVGIRGAIAASGP